MWAHQAASTGSRSVTGSFRSCNLQQVTELWTNFLPSWWDVVSRVYLQHHGVSAASADDTAERAGRAHRLPTCSTWTPPHLPAKGTIKLPVPLTPTCPAQQFDLIPEIYNEHKGALPHTVSDLKTELLFSLKTRFKNFTKKVQSRSDKPRSIWSKLVWDLQKENVRPNLLVLAALL